MQTMSTDQQARYPNPAAASHQPNYGYSVAEYPYQAPQNGYGQQIQMHPMFHNPQMYSGYPQQSVAYAGGYAQGPPMMRPSGPRPMHPSQVPVVRQANEITASAQSFIPQNQYQIYSHNPGTAPNTFGQPSYISYPMANQAVQQPSYAGATNSSRQPIVSNEQPQASAPSQPVSTSGKREKKPLLIQDPLTGAPVVLPTPAPPANVAPISTEPRPAEPTTDSTVATEKPTKETDTTQIQANFRQEFAKLLAERSQPKEKNTSSPASEEQTNAASTKVKPVDTAPVPPSNADSQPSNPIEDPQPVLSEQPKIPSEPAATDKPVPPVDDTDNKADQPDSPTASPVESEKTPVDSADNVQPVPETLLPAVSTSSPAKEPPQPENPALSDSSGSESRSIEQTVSRSKRTAYTIQELLKKRADPSSQQRPRELRQIDGVTKPPTYVGGTSMPNRGSIALEKLEFHNRAANAYVPVDRNRIDGNEKFLRDVKAILNKLTPQKYDELLKQLDGLELNSDQRLEGMIRIIFSKAVDEPGFCALYAKICKHYERTKVTVPNESGEMIPFYFRQILLSRCQKEFQNDYRQEIHYDTRLQEVQAITDEKAQKEAAEQLEEDLGKAKRKQFGNIFFIGELFKLQMLTEVIMYDCVEYLLREKSDEESIECLCRLLRTIGKELDTKSADKPSNRVSLEKSYRDMEQITTQRQTSSRIRFMIQDLLEQRKAAWVARRAEIKPMTIDEIHETERLKREQQERDQEQERNNRRRDPHRGGHSQQQYSESRGSRGSGTKQASNRTVDDRNEPRFDVDSVRQLHSSDKKNPGTMPMSLAPPRAWGKGSGVEKKAEDPRSYSPHNSKSSTMPSQASKTRTGPYPNAPAYANQRQSSRELPRDNSQRAPESNADPWRKANSQSVDVADLKGVPSTSSRDSSVSKTAATTEQKLTSSLSTDSTATSNADTVNATFDEEKIQARVHALIEEFTGNYSDATDRPVKEALEDLADFCTTNVELQTFVFRELITNVFEAKPRARKAVGHLLDAAFHKDILSEQGILQGFKSTVEVAPDFAVDIPLIWQYIAEVIGAFIGAPSANMSLLKPLMQSIPDDKAEKFFQSVIRYAAEFSSKASIAKFWQASDLSVDDFLKVNSAAREEYSWLSVPPAETSRPKAVPTADPKLVKLFKSVTDQETKVTDEDITKYINENMNKADKFYIRNIVLSYLEACLINRDAQKKIQEHIMNERMPVLKTLIENDQDAEIQAVYAIQNFVHNLEHPFKMAPLLFEYFYESECVSEEALNAWLKNPNQAESEGHSVVEMSTKDFFAWLDQAEEEEES